MANGFAGKILRVDLTARKTSIIETAKYEQWGGGHGIGSAIFFDLVKDKTIKAFDPANVVTVMSSPLSGTAVPACAGRTEVQGIGAQSWPKEWFTRSNFGGRFGAHMKYAGWDGIVLEGKADKPVWLNIVNDKVVFQDAGDLWGKDTYETQKSIWAQVIGEQMDQWHSIDSSRDGGRTTQRPAVLTIGPAGENLSRVASLIHDAGNGAGQGGFGGVWGSKNLKAISVLGTGSVELADPKALADARLWIARNYQYNVDDPAVVTPLGGASGPMVSEFGQGAYPLFSRQPGFGPELTTPVLEPSRPQGCLGCHQNCRIKTQSGQGNESQCVDGLFSSFNTVATADELLKATDLFQKLGVNAFEFVGLMGYLVALNKMGILGKGKKIHTDIDIADYMSYSTRKALLEAIAYRTDIGKDLAEGTVRAMEKWGRLGDLDTGIARFPNWGYSQHYDPRIEVEWGYGSILGDRDINEHEINWGVFWQPLAAYCVGEQPAYSAERLSKIYGEKLVPYKDPMMINYSEEGIYSDAKVKMIAWHRHYTRFFKQSLGFCDWAYANFINPSSKNGEGYTPEAEPKFYNAVSGKHITFEDGMEMGRKIWNLDRAIWALQGRHRDQEVFSGYVYDLKTDVPYMLPIFKDGVWSYDPCMGRKLDRTKFEDWKTRYFTFEGWDPKTGWPTQETLSKLGLDNVAAELKAAGKLGA
jgi:aldehyde:ferredoxin oxidoreductase